MKTRPLLAFLLASTPCFLQHSRAEFALDLTLDDPKGMLANKPEGLSKLTPDFSSSTATIASGTGGRALPQINSGPDSERADGAPSGATVQVASAPPLLGRPFFRASLDGAFPARSVEVGIRPDASASMHSLASFENGKVALSGGFDFLFRVTADPGFPKISLSTKVSLLSVNLRSDPDTGKFVLRLSADKGQIEVGGDQNGGKKSSIEKSSEAAIENGAIYHGAILFRTSADGSFGVDFCLAPGTGPLDPKTSATISIDGVGISGGKPASGQEWDKIVLGLGRVPDAKQVIDIGAVRIFSATPEVIPGFEKCQP